MSLHITLCLLSCKCDLINWRAGFCAPYALNFARSELWQISQKPLIDRWQLRQKNCVKSARRLYLSANLINTISQECPLRKHDILGAKMGERKCSVDQTSLFPINSLKILGRKLTGRQLLLSVVSYICGKGWHYSLNRAFALIYVQPLLFWLLLIVSFQPIWF